MIRLFAIARNAFTETIRQPMYYVLLLVSFVLLVLSVPLAAWTMGRGYAEYKETDQLFLVTMGLSTLLTTTGLFMAAFSASGILARMLEDKTILTVVSKPVPRALVVGGVYLGVAAALTLAYYVQSLAFLMTVRHGVMPAASDPYDLPVLWLGLGSLVVAMLAALFCNYVFGWHYTSAAVGFKALLFTVALCLIAFLGKEWEVVPLGMGLPPALLRSLLVGLLCVLVFAAVAVTASTRLALVPTLVVCGAFYVIGMAVDMVLGGVADRNPVTAALYWVWPKLTFFYTLDAIMTYSPIPWSYVGLAALYALCEIVAVLAVGTALFQRRELESQADSGSAQGLVLHLAQAGRVLAVVCGVLAIVVPGPYSLLVDLALGLGLGVAAVGGWYLWGAFARGLKWAYVVVALLAVAALARGGVAALLGGWQLAGQGWIAPAALIAAGTAVAAILILPKTRHHFGFVR